MDQTDKCQLAVCHCQAQEGRRYCSKDCEQAASQGVEREFCQCSHPGCTSVQHTLQVDAVGLRDSFRFFKSGQITIEYRDLEDLTGQVTALAAALSQQTEQAHWKGSTSIDRRTVASESSLSLAQSQRA